MTILYRGNTVSIRITPGDSNIVELVDGYSFEQIHITTVSNIWGISQSGIHRDQVYIFPPVKSKSPYILTINIVDKSKEAELRFIIEKFGQIPDAHYFDTAFEPILVKGDDGKEYNVIPSDQFK